MAGLIQLSILLPGPEWYDSVYFATGIGNTWRIVLASLTAFTVGKYVNDRLFTHFKGSHTGMQGFKFRAMASSIIGHVLDTTIFILIAFAFLSPWGVIPEMIIVGVCTKWGYEWLALPLTVKIVKKVRAYEGIDINSK